MPEIGVEIQAIDNTGRGIKNAEKSMGRLKGAVRGVTSAAKLAAFGIGGIAIAGIGIGAKLASEFHWCGQGDGSFCQQDGAHGRAVVGDGVCGGKALVLNLRT